MAADAPQNRVHARSPRRRRFSGRWRAAAAGLATGFGGAVLALALALFLTGPASANAKYAGFVFDVVGNRVLYQENADALRYPASLTKMMTLYIVFEELDAGRLSLGSRFTMSRYAAARPPSKIGIAPGGTMAVRDAIKALVTKSANDVATMIAENVSGSEPAFATRMTETARRLGMKRTTFRNAHGLPDDRQHTTARDMATLGLALQRDFPQYFGVFQTRVFEYGSRRYGNHNRLLGQVEGVDGIKTGYIRASGFNLVTSVRRDGRQLVAVVMGGHTGRSRDAHMAELIERYLPRAAKGRPLVYAAWSDRDPPPVPRSKPELRTLFAARLKAHTDDGGREDPIGEAVLAFAAEMRGRAPGDPAIRPPDLATGALRAVIAQAEPEAPVPATADRRDAQDAQPPGATDAEARPTTLTAVATAPAVMAGADDGRAARATPTAELAAPPAPPGSRVERSFALLAAAAEKQAASAGAGRAATEKRRTGDTGLARRALARLLDWSDEEDDAASGGLTIIEMGSARAHEPRPAPPSRSRPIDAQRAFAPTDRSGSSAPHAARDVSADAVPAGAGADRPAASAQAAPAMVTPVPVAGAAPPALGATSPPAPAAAAARAPTPPETPDGWQIQIGAVASPELADRLLDEAARINPAVDQQPRVTLPVTTARGTLYRARFAGFASQAAAVAACKRFDNHNRPCWAVSM